MDKLIVWFDLLFRNNEERSTKISLSYGPDDIHFLSIPNAAWVSEDASVDGAWWERKSCEFELINWLCQTVFTAVGKSRILRAAGVVMRLPLIM